MSGYAMNLGTWRKCAGCRGKYYPAGYVMAIADSGRSLKERLCVEGTSYTMPPLFSRVLLLVQKKGKDIGGFRRAFIFLVEQGLWTTVLVNNPHYCNDACSIEHVMRMIRPEDQ
jgi:hypothetical protein